METFLGSEQLSLSGVQRNLLEGVDYARISRGAIVSPETIMKYMPAIGGLVLNAGCGPGDKVMEFARLASSRYGPRKVVGVDLNPLAILQARRLSEEEEAGWMVSFLVADVANDLAEKLKNHRGFVDVVVAEGLFCNLLGDDPQRALVNINQLLRPGGWLIVADCLRVDDSRAVPLLLEEGYRENDITIWQEKWLRRYEYNLKLRIGLRSGEFLVVAPGEGDMDDFKELEFGDPEILDMLRRRGMVERYACHRGREEWGELMRQAGFEQGDWREAIWKSRTNEPTLGMVAAFEKVAESG